jgi:formate hydrogenlyase transcriptional activator
MTPATVSSQVRDLKGEIRSEIGFDVDSIPALIHTARPDGYFDYFNKSWLEYLGATLDDVTGWRWRAFVHPEDVEGIVAKWRACLATGRIFEHETRLRRANGEYRWMFHRKVPLRDETGKIVKWYGSSLEIEDRKWAEEELLRSEAYLSEAQRLSHTGSFGWDVLSGEIYWSDETFRIFELEPKTKITTDLIVQQTHPDDRQAVQQVIERASSERTEFALEHRLLMPDGSIKYLRVVGRPLQDEGGRSEFVGAVTDITDQRRAEESLRKSEAYLADAQRLSHTGSWAWSPEEGIKYWSEECYRVLGFDPRDGLPRLEELLQRVHPDDRPGMTERVQRMRREKVEVETDYRIVHPDGGIRNIHNTCHPVLGPSGELIEFIGTMIDVTERKRAEEELRASERKYRHLVDTTPAFIHTALPDGALDFLSRGWLEYGGLALTDLVDWRWTAAIHPEDVERFADKWRAALASGEPFEAESRVRRADGEYRWFLQRNVPLRDETGRIVKWYGTGIDIEERKTAEDKIRAQETELRQILELAPQHIGVFGPDGSPLYANHVALEYFGITIDQWRASSRINFVHPDDREHFRGERENRFLEGAPYEFEVRLMRHDGEFRHFLIRRNPVKDERGQIIRWYSTATDIEDRKRAEDEIKKENIVLREEIDKTSMFEEIVGVSAPLQSVLTDVSKVAPTDSTVLITGETGTGKELVARAIHKLSRRSARPFVTVNCAAIPSSLIASELFGHEKGAFTGATQRRQGRFELAEGGTIFLDEVGELPAEIQIALLRVLQEREFERVGSSRPIRADVRVIAATNRDLESAIAEKTFRSDLYYRLNVFPVFVPPLRERREDIPLLVEYFLHRFAKQAGKRINKISKETLNIVESYDWPGNVRELQNVVERAVIVSESDALDIDERWLLGGRTAAPFAAQPIQHIYRPRTRATQEEEKEAIETALMECKGRVSGPFGAASQLGLPSSTLESKIKALKIDKSRFRQQ